MIYRALSLQPLNDNILFYDASNDPRDVWNRFKISERVVSIWLSGTVWNDRDAKRF